jgi:hypothetical protein
MAVQVVNQPKFYLLGVSQASLALPRRVCAIVMGFHRRNPTAISTVQRTRLFHVANTVKLRPSI